MLVNSTNLSSIFAGFKTAFNGGFAGTTPFYTSVAMIVNSNTREEKYGWLKQDTGLREWLGPRIVGNLALSDWTISNRKFEKTVSITREDIEDDQYGVLSPFLTEMGRATAEHPDTLVGQLLKDGFTTTCYDGQTFFDTDHPVGDGVNVATTSVSNVQAGSGPAWYLLDTSRAAKPVVYQERVKPVFTSLDRENDENVFHRDEYIYGVRARHNVGYGLWQLAFGSKADLTPDNYEAARTAMMNFAGDGGRPLGVKPNMLVVPPSLEGAAMRLLNNGTRVETVGGVPVPIQNEWANSAKIIVTPWVT